MKHWLTLVMLTTAVHSTLSTAQISSQRAPWYKDSKIVRELQLNDNQIKSIELAVVRHLPALDALRTELERQESVLQSLVGSNLLDDKKIQSQVDVVLSARRNLERENTALSLDIRRSLSLQQWQKLQLIQRRPAAIQESPPQPSERARGTQKSDSVEVTKFTKGLSQPKVMVFQSGTFITSDFSQGVIHQIGTSDSTESARTSLPNPMRAKMFDYVPPISVFNTPGLALRLDSVNARTLTPECIADLHSELHNVGSEKIEAFVLTITATLKSGRRVVADHFYDATLTKIGQSILPGSTISQNLLPIIKTSSTDQILNIEVGVDLVCYRQSCSGPDQTRHADLFVSRAKAVRDMRAAAMNVYRQKGAGALLEGLQSKEAKNYTENDGWARLLNRYWLTIYGNRGLNALLDELR